MKATLETKMTLTLGENDSEVEVLTTAECCYKPFDSSYDLVSVVVVSPGDSEFSLFEEVDISDYQYGLVKDAIWKDFMTNYV